MKDLIKELEAYALENYEAGGHWVYETHTENDYAMVLVNANGDIEQAKKLLREDWELTHDLCEDIRNA